MGSSVDMSGTAYVGGMPVSRFDKPGANNPTTRPLIGPAKKPARRTGMCIGKNTLPPAPKAWKTMGSSTDSARYKAVWATNLTLETEDAEATRDNILLGIYRQGQVETGVIVYDDIGKLAVVKHLTQSGFRWNLVMFHHPAHLVMQL